MLLYICNMHTQQINTPTTGASSSTNIVVALSTLFVSLAMKYFSLDMVYYGMVYGLVTTLLSSLMDNKSWLGYDNIIYVPIIFVLILLAYYLMPYCKYYFQQYFGKQYITITMCEDQHVSQFKRYTEYNSKYYDETVNISIGDVDQKAEKLLHEQKDNISLQPRYEDRVSQEMNHQVKFNDKYLGVEGYYVWRKTTRERKDSENKVIKTITIRYIEYNILKRSGLGVNPDNIIKKMISFVTETEKNNLTLYYVKVMTKKTKGETLPLNHEVSFYSGTKEPFKTLEEKFMIPFFHQEKDRLWSMIKNMHLTPEFYTSKGQVARVSLLLHGPPGSGKSSLAYRIAKCLSRHIMSLDLREFDKPALYQMLQNPLINNVFTRTKYKDVVFLFEEFDISIKELYLREQKTKNNDDNHYSKLLSLYHKKSLKKYTKYNDKKEEKDKDNNKTSNGENDITCFDRNYTICTDEFKLRDLLEVFQGPVPFESMIMIANTNKYDEIKEMCPELFRPGRITPIYFGYINKETLQDVSKYFFGKKLSGYIPDILSVPTSQIIELAFEAMSFGENSYEYFSEQMNKLMNT